MYVCLSLNSRLESLTINVLNKSSNTKHILLVENQHGQMVVGDNDTSITHSSLLLPALPSEELAFSKRDLIPAGESKRVIGFIW